MLPHSRRRNRDESAAALCAKVVVRYHVRGRRPAGRVDDRGRMASGRPDCSVEWPLVRVPNP
jgi:hypothetical protein